jgi:two-component system cell cycle response regulator
LAGTPRAATVTTQEQTLTLPEDTALRERALILLVEDSPTQALRTRLVLEAAGFQVQVCNNGARATTLAVELMPDLLLLDMQLPGLDGRAVAQHLKHNPALDGMPIIFLTGVFREVEDIISGLEEGADDYLVKPVQDDELIARVKASLRASKTRRELGRLAHLLVTVNRMGSQLAGIFELERLLESAVQLIHDNFEFPHVFLFLKQDQALVLAGAADPRAASLLATPPHLPLSEDSLAAACVRSGQLERLAHTEQQPASHPFLHAIRSGAAAPLRSAGQIIGVLEIASGVDQAFSTHDRLVLQTLADMVGAALHNAQLYQQMETLAMQDELTTLLNRRALLARLRAEWERSQRYQHNLSLVSVDLDGLKQINDQYGHSLGDQALRAIGGLLRGAIRGMDVAGRLSGDEFLILLPETDQPSALEVARRLLAVSQSLHVTNERGEPVPLTMSLGVATWPAAPVAEASELLRVSDEALYRAKLSGRNRVSL